MNEPAATKLGVTPKFKVTIQFTLDNVEALSGEQATLWAVQQFTCAIPIGKRVDVGVHVEEKLAGVIQMPGNA